MANGTFSNNDRSLAQLEVDALTTQFEKVASGTKFNNKEILNASSSTTYQIQSGANQDENFTIFVIEGATLSANVTTDADVTSQLDAQATMNSMITHLNTAEAHLATIGASINRLYATISNLSASSVNTEFAFGRISDTDFARETANLAKQQILSNSANQMLVTANRSKNLLTALLA
jgi:flagellin